MFRTSQARTPFSVPGESMPAWPTPDEEGELLRKLLDHRAVASTDLFRAYYEPLLDWLAALHGRTDESFRADAAVDAIASLAKRSESYMPERGKSLADYLKMSAAGDLKNLLDKERRRTAKRNPEFDVALLKDRGNEIGMEMELQEETDRLEATVLALVKDGLSTEELAALQLYCEREKKTDAYAPVLKVDHLPHTEREAAVKRFKDKIGKRIDRAREVHDESP